MGFDQTINYKVAIDDSNFQAKLTQMRASIDSVVGGGAGGGFSNSTFAFGAMSAMNSNFGSANLSGGLADFGAQVRPVTFTPPAIAMQPHFGMYQIQQTLGQAGLAASFGPYGVMASGMMSNGIMSTRDPIPQNMSYQEYINMSTRGFADRMGGMATAATSAATTLGFNIGGGLAGTAAGFMMGGPIGAFIGSIAGGMGAGMIGESAAERSANQQAIQSTLANSSFRFFQGNNVDPVTGRGFNRQDRNQIATDIMRMETRDARLNTTDYRQILESGAQMDLFSGTRDADDFTRKFKDLVSTVKTVTTTLHTSLKEGMETIRGLRDMGVTDPVQMQSMVMKSDVLGRMSGRTGMEMMAVGQTGAEMFRGTGISMQRGFDLNQQNTSMVRSMLNSGAISRETVAQAGGELALAQQMTAGALSSFQTLQGRGAMMAMFNPATMSMDPNMLSKMAAGGTIGMMSQAAGNMSSVGNLFKFQAHQEELISQMNPMQMQMFGIAQGMMGAKTLRGAFGNQIGFEDAYVATRRRDGVGIEQIKTELGMLKMDAGEFKEQQEKQVDNMRIQQNVELKMREQILAPKLLSNMFNRNVTQPLSEMATGIGNDVSEMTEGMLRGATQFLTGQALGSPTLMNQANNEGADRVLQRHVSQRIKDEKLKSGGSLTDDQIRAVAEKESRALSQSGLVDSRLSGFRKFFGQRSSHDDVLDDVIMDKDGNATLGGQKIKTFADAEVAAEYAKRTGKVLHAVGTKDGKFIALDEEMMGASIAAAQKLQVDPEKVEKHRSALRGKAKGVLETLDKKGKENVTTEDIARLLVKDEKFSMDKFYAGSYPDEVYEKVNAVALEGKYHSAGADLKTRTNVDSLRNFANQSSGVLQERAAEVNSRVQQKAGAIFGYDSKLVKAIREGKAPAISDSLSLLLDNDAGNDKGAFNQLINDEYIKGGDVEKIKSDIARAKKSGIVDIQSLQKDILQSASLQRASKDVLAGASGKDSDANAGYVGDMSKATMKALVEMSNQLNTNYKTLLAMQQQFEAALNK